MRPSFRDTVIVLRKCPKKLLAGMNCERFILSLLCSCLNLIGSTNKIKIRIRINNKMNLINKINIRLAKAKTKVTNKIKLVYKAMCKLQDDSWLRLVELNKIDAILDDALNVVRYEIYGKNRKSSKIINIDKHKSIDGYVSKLTVIINYKIKLMNIIISKRISNVMCNIKNKTNMVNEKIHKASEIDNDTLHLIDDNLNEIITYLRKGLKRQKKD